MDFRNWPIPHNAKLDRQIEPGQLVIIRGRVLEADPETDPRLTINFASSGNGYDAATIPLHVAFRFSEKAVVLNTKSDNEWAKEQRKSLPVKLGEEFDIRIRIHGDKYELMVNHKDFAAYDHIKPVTQVSHIFIDGPIVLHAVNWGGKYYSVPYESGINSGFGPGKRLFVSGVPEKKGNRFNINLLNGNGDVALHFNPRFDEKCVVRNTKKDGEWGKEEREGKFELKKDHAVDVMIVNEQYSYQIYINNEQFCAYAHRVDPHTINGVQVQGDFELQSIMVM